MELTGILYALSKQRNKKDYIKTVEDMLNALLEKLAKKYNVTAQNGFVGMQAINFDDLMDVSIFNVLHHIYWGLINNTWNNKTDGDELLYKGIKGFVTEQFSNLP